MKYRSSKQMKRLLLIPVLYLVGCSDVTISPNEDATNEQQAANTTPVTQPETGNSNEEKTTNSTHEDLSVDEMMEEKETSVEEYEPPQLTGAERSVYIDFLDAINTTSSWDSYFSVSTGEHIVPSNAEHSYSYKETLAYKKQPHETHSIYESHNPQYMEVYANETDGAYFNDSAETPNWTFTTDEEQVGWWQKEELPRITKLLRAIADASDTFTIVDRDTQTVELFVSVPSSEIDALLLPGEGGEPFHMFFDLTCTVTFSSDGIVSYEIVGDYVTQDNIEGQFIVSEAFSEVNNLAHVRVPAHVKEQAIHEDHVIEWNE